MEAMEARKTNASPCNRSTSRRPPDFLTVPAMVHGAGSLSIPPTSMNRLHHERPGPLYPVKSRIHIQVHRGWIEMKKVAGREVMRLEVI